MNARGEHCGLPLEGAHAITHGHRGEDHVAWCEEQTLEA